MVRTLNKSFFTHLCRDEGLSQGEVFADTSENLQLMDAAEKEFQKEHAFEVPEIIPVPTANPDHELVRAHSSQRKTSFEGTLHSFSSLRVIRGKL